MSRNSGKKVVRLAELAELVGGEIDGDPDVEITGINSINLAVAGEITFLSNPKYRHLLKDVRASALLTQEPVDIEINVLRVQEVDAAFSRLVDFFVPRPAPTFRGVHAGAVLAGDVALGKNVTIGPFCVVEDGVVIGDNTVLWPGCYVGSNVVIGADCVLHAHVAVLHDCTIGNRVVIRQGAVIGSDGFGYTMSGGRWNRIPQIGIVEIGDDVEIGANTCVDRARFDKTAIGRGSKIDNLVQIGHNVTIGEHAIIVSQVGIAGSSSLGNYVTVAGQSGIGGHVEVGDHSVVAAKTGVSKDLPPGSVVSGMPGHLHRHEMRCQAAYRRLPELLKTFRELQEKVEKLEKETEIDRR